MVRHVIKELADRGYEQISPGWLRAPVPSDEEARLAELHSLGILDTPPEPRFDRLTDLATKIFDVPIAVLSLIDRERQWFKSSCGLAASETPRDWAFCSHALLEKRILVVPDATLDPRFSGNPLVVGDPEIRFYAGAVLHSPTGIPLGTLCIIDTRRRELSSTQVESLEKLAAVAEEEIFRQRELQSLRLQTLQAAFVDPSTGVASRQLCEDRLSHALALAQIEPRAVAVLNISLRQAGDFTASQGSKATLAMMKALASRIRTAVDDAVTIGRWSESQFCVILPTLGRLEDALKVAEGMLPRLQRPLVWQVQEVHPFVSIGISVFPEHGDDVGILLERAAQAARDLPAGKIRFFDEEVAADLHRRFQISSALKLALVRNEMSIHYQPKLRLGDGALIGVEALMRWYHPLLGSVSPGEFIPIAEATGQVIELGEWILNRACEQANDWSQQGWPISVAVNLSPREISEPGFLDRLAAVLTRHSLPRGCLELELTETCLIEDLEYAVSVMKEICTLGVTLSLDDFGTGFSSLTYLQRSPFKLLKIDRSFVNGLDDSPSDRAIVSMSIQLAHTLQMKVVAEGVETSSQLEILRELGCDIVQGYLFGKPETPENITKRLESGDLRC